MAQKPIAPYQDNEQEFSQFGFTDTQIKGFIGFHETDDITPDLFGKAVIVRGLTDWNSTDNSFRLSKATGEKRIAIRYGSTTKVLSELPVSEILDGIHLRMKKSML